MCFVQSNVFHRLVHHASFLLLIAIAALSPIAPLAQAQSNPELPPATLRVEGIKIKVTDLQESLTFYRDLLGFAVLSDEHKPATITLDGGGLPIILEPTTRPAQAGYPEASQTSLSLETYDLAATMAHLKAREVAFLQDPPIPYGRNEEGTPLGLTTKFEDPSGNIISLVEQQFRRGDAFSGIRIYNAGFYLPDIEKARTFYCDLLGFVALTEQYYPNIPLGYTDHAFAFMLHGQAQIQHAAAVYPETAQLLLVFSTSDLGKAAKLLDKQGVIVLDETPRTLAGERYIAFQDPFGNVSEVYERR